MAAHAYSLRSRLSGQSPSARVTPTVSPLAKSGLRSPRKAPASNVSLQLKKVIGTTTAAPPGLACCPSANTYAYCAGAVAVLATVQNDGTTTERYFKARPTASSLNPSYSYYDTNSPSTTPSKRRSSVFNLRKPQDQDSSRDWLEDGGSQTWTARERIKTVTCVALSDNGKWLAVGESGYSPRVLLYSTTDDALVDTPVSIVSDHTVGVKSVAFSPDGRYLATLGNLNDGFLFIWSVNRSTGQLSLHSANKCTTNVNDMVWCGSSLVTVGTRHVKVWQMTANAMLSPTRRFKLRSGAEDVASPRPSTIHGRNALLGSLNDCTFTSAVDFDQTAVFIGTDAGHICVLQTTTSSLEVQVITTCDFGITTIAWQGTSKKLLIGSSRGIAFESFPDIDRTLQRIQNGSSDNRKPSRKVRRSSAIRQSLGLDHSGCIGVSAVGSLSQHAIALDTNGNLHLHSADDDDNTLAAKAFACHSDAIQGVDHLPAGSSQGAFYTWSRRGEVRFWDTGGRSMNQAHVELEQQDIDCEDDQNELKVLRHCHSTSHFIAGDRFGILKLFRASDWQCLWTGRAHGAEIMDITVHDGSGLVATCSRDRMIQVFAVKDQSLDLLQTLDDHIGAVNHVCFSTNGQKLLSCSADRMVVVRERVQRQSENGNAIAFLSSRVVTLKSNPMSMAFTDKSSTTLLVSTMDRHVVRIDPSNGAILESLKVTDPDNDDTVTLNTIHISGRGSTPEEAHNLLVAFSSTDKSIRIFDAEKCQLLARDSGHTEGISDICLIDHRLNAENINRTLVSTGLDGTIMIWNIAVAPPILMTPAQERTQLQTLQGYDSDATPTKASPASLPPLRKVLTKMDVIEFSKSSGLTSPASPSSLRAHSPARLVRKKSNLALSATIDEKDEDTAQARSADNEIEKRGRQEATRSPSPPPSGFAKPKKQRSRSEVGGDPETRKSSARRSPSPTAAIPSSTPTTPRHCTQANNSRLRRPPSMPNDLRAQALAQGRRQSMTVASDFGSVAMATEQACRMLKTYKKKLAVSKEDLALDELEEELESMLKLVKEKKDRTATPKLRRKLAKAATENDVDDLVALMERTDMGNRRPMEGVSVQG